MMKRRLRTRLSFINPDLAQVKQKEYNDETRVQSESVWEVLAKLEQNTVYINTEKSIQRHFLITEINYCRKVQTNCLMSGLRRIQIFSKHGT